MGCRSVHIGGGEPLLRPDNLAEILGVAQNVGVLIEYVNAKRVCVNKNGFIPRVHGHPLL